MKKFRRKNFTLLELAAVIAILILLTAVSGVYIGRERKLPEFERALRDFQVFCARARTECVRDGVIRKVVFYPDEMFSGSKKSSPGAKAKLSYQPTQLKKATYLMWCLTQ